jgi:hypothetical protein
MRVVSPDGTHDFGRPLKPRFEVRALPALSSSSRGAASTSCCLNSPASSPKDESDNRQDAGSIFGGQDSAIGLKLRPIFRTPPDEVGDRAFQYLRDRLHHQLRIVSTSCFYLCQIGTVSARFLGQLLLRQTAIPSPIADMIAWSRNISARSAIKFLYIFIHLIAICA